MINLKENFKIRLQLLKNDLPKLGPGMKQFSGMQSSVSFGKIYLPQYATIYNYPAATGCRKNHVF